jgi:hypothetical protein
MDLKKIIDEIEDISDSLNGLSGLFTISGDEVMITNGELYGLGKLTNKLSNDLSKINDELRVCKKGK